MRAALARRRPPRVCWHQPMQSPAPGVMSLTSSRYSRPELLAGLDHGGADRRAVHLRGEQRPVLAADLGFLALPAFRFAEIGQAVVPRPAAVAELGPVIVILGLAADVDEPVDRRGAADHPAARIDDGAAVGAGIGLGAEFPGQGVVVEHLEEAGRDVDQRVPVLSARLDQQDFGVGILGQPVGQHATGRARPDDDVIRLHALHSRGLRFRPTIKLPISRSLAHRGRTESSAHVPVPQPFCPSAM